VLLPLVFQELPYFSTHEWSFTLRKDSPLLARPISFQFNHVPDPANTLYPPPVQYRICVSPDLQTRTFLHPENLPFLLRSGTCLFDGIASLLLIQVDEPTTTCFFYTASQDFLTFVSESSDHYLRDPLQASSLRRRVWAFRPAQVRLSFFFDFPCVNSAPGSSPPLVDQDPFSHKAVPFSGPTATLTILGDCSALSRRG